MNANSLPLEPPDTVKFEENRRKIPWEYLLPYVGLHVAWNGEGTRIVASGKSLEEVAQNLDALGISFGQVIHDYIDDL